MHVRNLQRPTLFGFLRAFLPLLFAFFLVTSNYNVAALVVTKDCTIDTATVKSSQVTLMQGTKASSTISTTQDYATVISTAGFTFYENSSSAGIQTYNPTSMSLLVGSNLVGSVSNLTSVDGIYVAFNETNGSPGFDFYFNFTGVASASSFGYNIYEYYKGNPGHTVEIDLYNYTSSSWVVYEQLHGESGFTWHNNTVTSTASLIQSGIAMGRLVHTGGGSTTHYELIDYIGLSTSGAQTNTDFSIPPSTGSLTIAAGSSFCLYSPPFSSATTVYAGTWLLDLWASATTSGTLSISYNALNSSNNIVATAATGASGTIGTSKAEVLTSLSGLQISVPSGGCLMVSLTNPSGSGKTFTIYWGSGQGTNFQSPADFDYVVAVPNAALVAYSVSLSTYSSSSISRLTNLTVTVYSPSSNQIIITNGAFTQSAGSTVTISASSTLYIKVYATANAFGCSNVVLLIKFSSVNRPFAFDAVNLTVN